MQDSFFLNTSTFICKRPFFAGSHVGTLVALGKTLHEPFERHPDVSLLNHAAPRMNTGLFPPKQRGHTWRQLLQIFGHLNLLFQLGPPQHLPFQAPVLQLRTHQLGTSQQLPQAPQAPPWRQGSHPSMSSRTEAETSSMGRGQHGWWRGEGRCVRPATLRFPVSCGEPSCNKKKWQKKWQLLHNTALLARKLVLFA